MRIILTFIIGFILQSLLYRNFPIPLNIDIMLIITIEISLIRDSSSAEVFGFFSGLVEDILFFGMWGQKALIRTLAGFIGGRFKGKFNEGNFFFQLIITALIYIFAQFLGLLISLIMSGKSIYPPNIILSALLNGLLAFFVYHILKRFNAV